MTDKTIIIGAGHNGLVCAAYLAKAGRDVLVLEAADQVGGAAVTREFAPGCNVSAAAHLLYALDPQISKALGLEQHGLKLAATNMNTVSLAQDGNHLVISGAEVSGAGISAEDQASLKKYRRLMDKFAALMGKFNQKAIPRINPDSYADLWGLAKLAVPVRLLGKKDMEEFLRLAAINIFDAMQEYFDHPMLKGALALDAVLGTNLGTRSNNSVFTALQRASSNFGGAQGAVCQPHGGMGAVTAALAKAAEANGAEIRTSTPVASIVMDSGRATGVILEDGSQIDAACVVSNADPKTTFLGLVGARNVEAGFVQKISNLRARGNVAKLHLLLNGAPSFNGVNEGQLGQRLVIAPSMEYIEHAFNSAKYGEYSENPAMEISVPTIADPSLAPAGNHVLSVVVQYAPLELKGGWDAGRQGFMDRCMTVLEQYAPGIRAQVEHSELLTAVDIEREFRITGGHWHHAELALDQALMLRPVPGAAQYKTPVEGLFLCGAGAHPGGGVMGNAGKNAANAILGNKS